MPCSGEVRIFVLEETCEQRVESSHIKGLLQKVTVLDAFDFVEGKISRAKNKGRVLIRTWIRTQGPQHGRTQKARHHIVRYDQIKGFGHGFFQSLMTIAGLMQIDGDQILLHLDGQEFQHQFVIFGHQYFV